MFTQTELAYLYSACLASAVISRENERSMQADEFYRLSTKICLMLEKEDENNKNYG